jgi:DNA-binding IclR family transcriptional regulator
VSGVQSVERALVILRALSSGPAGVTELADRVELAKSTVSRMLATLETAGAVEQVEGGGPYRLGPLIAEIASALAPTRSLIQSARPLLSELTEAIGEASGLSVREGPLVRYVLQAKQNSEVQVRDWTGFTAPLHVGPSGLVLLAHARADDIDSYLSNPIEPSTDRTITEVVALRARLAAIRKQGHEWVFGEVSLEINSVAAPVVDGSGHIVAAVHVHGPSFRFPENTDRETVTRRLMETAARLSETLRA